MATLKIPKNYLPAYETIAEMPEEKVVSICNFLESLNVGINPLSFSKLFFEEFPEFTDPSVPAAIFTLGTIKVAEKLEEPTEEIIELLVQSFAQETAKANKNELTVSLKNNLSAIVKSSLVIYKSYKAMTLFKDSKNVFSNAKIVSDIKVVFDEEVLDTFVDAIISHELRITVDQNDTEEILYINLNYKGLKILQQHINRALEKDDLMKKSFSNLNFIEIVL